MKNNTEAAAHGAGDGAENFVCNVRFELPPKPPLGWAQDYVLVNCPRCRGYGFTSASVKPRADRSLVLYGCKPCRTLGVVERRALERIERGERLRRWRRRNELTLRAAAFLVGKSARNVSDSEYGLVENVWIDSLLERRFSEVIQEKLDGLPWDDVPSDLVPLALKSIRGEV